ncbi:MAG: DeoR/GlpR transcriptional regulator [Lachnospiraceae bacterium]|nr:DeoR/GlpR transcriptional regulator [Lachnospiraceae bacterium]
MIAETRRQRILELLQQQKAVSVAQLAELLDSSVSTIRRDLIALDEQGLLNRVHGGAAIDDTQLTAVELDMLTKESIQQPEKEAIGRAAASMIRPDDFVYIDAGSTTLQLVKAIEGEALKAVYVTNGLAHTRALTQKGCSVYVPGGRIRQRTEAIVGATALSSLNRYNFTKSFLGVNGIDVVRGYTTPGIDERELKAFVAHRSKECWFLADESKFGKIYPAEICPIGSAFLLTNHLPDEIYRSLTTVKEVM